jgi:hypothetical protein
MLEGEYIKNNTRFCKPPKFNENDLIKRNIIFIYSDTLKEDISNLLKEDGINTIRLTDDYKLENLDFLKDYNLDFIESIDLLSDSVKNVDGLYNLKNLKHINSQKYRIDYTKFNKLISVGIEQVDKYCIEKLSQLTNLKRLSLLNKFSEIDLTKLSGNKKLEQLTIRGSKLQSLKGLENFPELENLNLFHNRSLLSLEGIKENHFKLKKIYIYIAPKLFYVNEYLVKLPKLKFLQLEAKKIDSFKFLDSLNELELVGIHNLLNESEDGDKKPLIKALKRTNGQIW